MHSIVSLVRNGSKEKRGAFCNENSWVVASSSRRLPSGCLHVKGTPSEAQLFLPLSYVRNVLRWSQRNNRVLS